MSGLSWIFVALATFAFANGVEYHSSIDGMQGLSLTCDTEEKLKFVRQFEDVPGFDFTQLTRIPGVPVDVLVTADWLRPFKEHLRNNGIHYEVTIEDVGKAVEAELAEQKKALLQRKITNDILEAFPRYGEIQEYLQKLAASHSDIVQNFSIGQSYEGREIVGVKISSGGEGKPALFIDAGIHAREWAAPATAVYAIKELVENEANRAVFKNIDIYIVPSLNPDGYEYTHQSANNRMWRKTRSKHSSSKCIGVDGNRNFDYQWMTIGASSYPCSETYAGPKAFSEPETSALRDFLLAHKNIKVYLTFHSYGNYLLHPWGFTEELPENEPTLRCVAKNAEAALSKIRGTHYTIGSSTVVLYAAAGGSDDWAMAVAGAELSYTIELPNARFGFAPPPSEIKPIGKESFEAIKVFAKYVEDGKC